MLNEMLYRVISVRQGERQLRMPVIQAMFHRFLEDSLKGNIKAARFLLDRLNAVASEGGPQSELNEDDQAILKAFTEDFLSGQKEQRHDQQPRSGGAERHSSQQSLLFLASLLSGA
jgi:hypothetical protein